MDWIIAQINAGRAPDRPLNGFLLILRLLRQQRRNEEEEREQGQCSRQAVEMPEEDRQSWLSHASRYLKLGTRGREKENNKLM